MTAELIISDLDDHAARRGHNRAAGDTLSIVAGIVGGLAVGAGIAATWGTWATPGGAATATGTITALAGTYLCLVAMVLSSRLPWLEREVGQDRLIGWHRKVGPWALILIVAHFVLTGLGYAQAAGVSLWDEIVTLVTTYPWMVPATLALAIMIFLGLTAIPAVRRLVAYETWWASHLYFYLAVVLAFGHQLTSGTLFSSHELLRVVWISLYVVVAAIIVWSRIGLPLLRSWRHDLRIDRVVREGDDLVSVYISGRNLARLGAQGGQFFSWRFLTRHWWWQAHPYSLSAGANGSWLRITVKNLGDQSGALTQLRPGTRVVAEGPYGVFTAGARRTPRIVAFAAGVGITPIRALLDDVPPSVDVTVVYRVASTDEDSIAMRDELEEIVSRRGWKLIYLPGPRTAYALSVDYLTSLVPQLVSSDVYVCGPQSFADAIRSAARIAGVPPRRVHYEAFAF